MESDVKVLIFSSGHCIRCKITMQMLEGFYTYVLLEPNKKADRVVFSEYNIDPEEDVPTFILLKDGKVVHSTQVPLFPDRIKQLLNS